jgi:hypothetical protein
LDDNFWAKDEKVTYDENELLEKEFSEEEVKKAIDESKLMEPQALMASHLCFTRKFGESSRST